MADRRSSWTPQVVITLIVTLITFVVAIFFGSVIRSAISLALMGTRGATFRSWRA